MPEGSDEYEGVTVAVAEPAANVAASGDTVVPSAISPLHANATDNESVVSPVRVSVNAPDHSALWDGNSP